MITISYIYDFEDILKFVSIPNENRDIVLPRKDEYVNIDDMIYRVVKITHVFSREAYNSEQRIVIELTRQLSKT